MNRIESFIHSIEQKVEDVNQAAGKFLDEHPTVFKVVLIGSHFFRAASIFALMVLSPLPLPITCGIILVGSLIYRAAVERFCSFRFALPSCVGGAALLFSQSYLITLILGQAFASLGLALVSIAGIVPLAFEIRKSDPVTAAVIAPACTFPPPAPFGEENSMVPLSRTISRVPAIKRKSALEPTRVMVRSGNCNSARELPPVLSAVSPLTRSPGAARTSCGKSETRLIVLVTSAWSKGSAHKVATDPTNTNRTKIQCLIG